MDLLWRVRLFDGPLLQDASGSEIRRFRSQRIGALLAYLALRLGRPCPREELCEALWPGEDLPVAANRLRVALASLRRQLEPSGVGFGAVLDVSEASRVRLRAETVWCDAVALERALRAGQRDEAAQLYAGPLLPGFYDDWVIAERERFEARCEGLTPTVRETRDVAVDAPTALGVTPPPGPRLPLYLTHFFGREAERARLAALLEESRLVTVLGPGGIGKTRLTVEAARGLPGPLVFVALADLDDAERLPHLILTRLESAPATGRDLVEQTIEALARARTRILVLDNAEHLLDAVAELALALLEAVPDLRILVTSRRRLQIVGEAILPLAPLEPPPVPGRPGRLTEFPAAALFLDRARSARPDFTLSDRQIPALVEICQRLEGIPLALELAAARVSAQTPLQIADALAHSVTSLRSGQRGLSERHRSLRAAVDGSLALLTPVQRRCFAALSVFRGGFTAEAAAAVTGVEDARAAVDELAACSLVTARDDAERDDVRFTLLETLRQVGAELQTRDEAREIRAAHARYYLALAAPATEGDVRTLDRLDFETENLLLALEWGWERRDRLFWLALSGWIYYAFARGQQRVAADWANRVLPLVDTIAGDDTALHVLTALGALLSDLGRFDEVRSVAGRLIERARRAGDDTSEVLGETFLGYVANNLAHFEEGIRIQKAALARARRLGRPALLQRCLVLTARALIGFGFNPESAPDERHVAAMEEADLLAREALAQISGHSRLRSLAELSVALAAGGLGHLRDYFVFLKQAQRTAHEHRIPAIVMYTYLYETLVEEHAGRLERAAQLYGAACDRRDRMGYDLGFSSGLIGRLQRSLTEALGAERLARLMNEGQSLSDAELMDGAMTLDLYEERIVQPARRAAV